MSRPHRSTQEAETVRLLDLFLRLDPEARSERFLTVPETARKVSVSRRTVLYWIDQGEILAVLVGPRYWVDRDSLLRFLLAKARSRI